MCLAVLKSCIFYVKVQDAQEKHLWLKLWISARALFVGSSYLFCKIKWIAVILKLQNFFWTQDGLLLLLLFHDWFLKFYPAFCPHNTPWQHYTPWPQCSPLYTEIGHTRGAVASRSNGIDHIKPTTMCFICTLFCSAWGVCLVLTWT